MPDVKFFLAGPCGCQANTPPLKQIHSLEAGFLLELRFCHDTGGLMEDCLETSMRTREWDSHQATWQKASTQQILTIGYRLKISVCPPTPWSERKCNDFQSIHVVGWKRKQLPAEILGPDRCSSLPVVAQGQNCGVLPLKLSVAFSHWEPA